MNQKYVPITMAVIAVIGIVIGMRIQESLVFDGVVQKQNASNVAALSEAIRHIQSKYYGEVSTEEIADGLIFQLVDKLDPYSRYYSPSQYATYQDQMAGHISGVGVEMLSLHDTVYIVGLHPDGSAKNKGIRLGDRIISIDSTVLSGTGSSGLRGISRYEIGDTLNMTVLQEGVANSYQLVLKRLKQSLIHHKQIDSEGVYIKLDKFYNGCFQDFMDVFDEAAKQGIKYKYLILDLRNNPGGVLDESIKLLNQFFKESKVKLLTSVTSDSREKKYFTNGRSFLNLERTVILTNRNSASASEIMAGCLQDLHKAVIIGDTTYGKGLIQQSFELTNGGSISITTGHYELPAGNIVSSHHDGGDHIKGVYPQLTHVSACELYHPPRRTIQEWSLINQAWALDLPSIVTAYLKDFNTEDPCADVYIMSLINYIGELNNDKLGWQELISLDKLVNTAADILYSTDRYAELIGAHHSLF